jgi:alpha-mannosidase
MESKGQSLVTRRDVLKGGSAIVLSTLVQTATGGGKILVWAQGDPKRIYIAADDHTDYFWSAGEETYRGAFLETIDYYLDLADATISAGEPVEHQSRWNCDGSFWMWTYEKNKSVADFQRLIDRIKSGHISVPLNALCVCLGGASTEAVLRGMYYPGQIERRYGLRFSLAYLMENQTQPYGVYSLWKGSGAKYSWKGICDCDTRVPNAWDREHGIYWATGPDGSRILLKWNSMLNGNQSVGGYAEARRPAEVVDYVDGDPDFIARYPYRVIGAFGKGWDDLKTLTDEFVTVAKQKTDATRTVIVSNEEDFFQDFEAIYGTGIPSHSSSFGNEWDLYCAALAEVSARVKRAVEKLRGAEALAALVSLQKNNFMDGRKEARDQVWMNLGLFWEHNFGMVGPPSGLTDERIVWQKRLADEIETYVDTLEDDVVSALGGLISRSIPNLRFYAFNPLSWTRTDVADLPYADTGPFHVIDLSTGLETPSQIVTVDGERRLRVLARYVPPVGYKVFEVRPGAGGSFEDAAMVSGNVISNDLYSLTVAARGAITGLVDKTRANREFAHEIDGRFINDLGPGTGSLQVENAGPVSVTLRATASGPLNHASRITLIRDVARIDIRNDVEENFDATYTWAFGFDLDAPDVWHEEVGAVIRAKLLDQGGHYSPRNARYDWLTLNHFADLSGSDGTGVTLSNGDCYFMRLGNSTVGNLDVNTSQISPLVGGRVVGLGGGLPDQGGDTHFLQRFALRTHSGYNAADAMRFALEHQNPLVTGLVTGGTGSLQFPYPEKSFSLLSISDPNVLLWALKPADDGIDHGIIARLWNLSSEAQNFTLAFTGGDIIEAKQTTHIETPIGDATITNGVLTESIAGQQLKTFALKTALKPIEPGPEYDHFMFLPGVTSSTQSTTSPRTATGKRGRRRGHVRSQRQTVEPRANYSVLDEVVSTLRRLIGLFLGHNSGLV